MPCTYSRQPPVQQISPGYILPKDRSTSISVLPDVGINMVILIRQSADFKYITLWLCATMRICGFLVHTEEEFPGDRSTEQTRARNLLIEQSGGELQGRYCWESWKLQVLTTLVLYLYLGWKKWQLIMLVCFLLCDLKNFSCFSVSQFSYVWDNAGRKGSKKCWDCDIEVVQEDERWVMAVIPDLQPLLKQERSSSLDLNVMWKWCFLVQATLLVVLIQLDSSLQYIQHMAGTWWTCWKID